MKKRFFHVKKLQDMGLEVVLATFPNVSIDKSFDFVLASHVISYRSTLLQPFIDKAVSLVSPSGSLLLITHRGGEADDWAALLKILGETVEKSYMNTFQDILNVLAKYGVVTSRVVVATVETKVLEDLLTALSFVYSNGKAELLQKWQANLPIIQKWLEEHYKTPQGYVFPFNHYFVTLKKA
jgi:SAM-dependent methyltransferase